MKVVVPLVILAFSTFVQSYKIRIIRNRYKHKTNRTASVDEQRTVPVLQKPQLDNSGRTYQYKHRYYDQAPDETAIKVIPAPRINRVVANLCKDANKDILVVWETVARVLGLDKGYPIQHRGELRKLTTIIRTFVTLSKENNFEQMPIHQILKTIDYNLEQVTHRNDIAEENIKAISRPYFGIPTLSSSIPGNEETYLEHLETDRSGFNAESLSTEPISVPSLKTPTLISNENIFEPTNSVSLDDFETELPFEASIDSNLIESINTGRLVELENGYKIIPATPSFLESDELITVISPAENAYYDISTEMPLDKETNILTTTSSLNPEELNPEEINTLQPIDLVHNSLETIHGDDVLEYPQSAEDNSDDEFMGSTRKSFGTLLDKLIMNLIQSSNITLRKDGHDVIHEDTNLYLDPDNKTPDYLNSHDSADLDEDILSLSAANSEAASLQSNNIDAINSQIDANHLGINKNTLVISSNTNLENPVELTPIANDSNVYLVSVSPLYDHENISSEKHLDTRRLLKIEDEFTISPVALQPDAINSLASTDQILFRIPVYIQKPFKQITPHDVKTSHMNLDPVEPDDDKTRKSIDPIDTSQINPDIMTPYVVDTSQINPNPAVSEDIDARQINLNSIASYDEDTGVNKIYPFNPNHVKTNQINLDPSVPYDPIYPNALYHVDTNLRNRVDNYDFDTSQINPDIMASYDVDTSQRNPNRASYYVNTGQTNQEAKITSDEDTSARNFAPVDPNDVETNQVNLGPSVLYDDVDKNYKNLDPVLPYDLINPNAPYDVHTNLRSQVNNNDFDTSEINPDIIAPYVVDTSQRNPNPAVSEEVDGGQTNLDSIISYDEDTIVRNFDTVNPNDVETNQINLGLSVLYDDVDTNHKNLDPTVPYDHKDTNALDDGDTNLRNQVNNNDFDTSQINPGIMAPYVVDTSQRNSNPAVSHDGNTRETNQDAIISYDEDTIVRNFDPVNHNDVETNQINIGPSVLYVDVDTSQKNLDPNVSYDFIDPNAPYDVDTKLRNRVDNYDFDTSQINPDIMAPYILDINQRNPNSTVSDDIDDEDKSVRNFDLVDPSDVKTNQISLGRSGLYHDINTSQKNLDPTVPYDQIDPNVAYEVNENHTNIDLTLPYDVDTNHKNIDLTVPYDFDINHRNLDPFRPDEVDTSRVNLDTIARYDVDTSKENLDPTVPYNVNTYQKNVDTIVAYDGQKSQINLGTIVSQDTDPSQRNDYPFISKDISATRKSFHLSIPHDVKVQQSLRNLSPVVLYKVGIAPYVMDTNQRNLNLVAPYKDTNRRYYDLAVPYSVKTSQKNLDLTAPYFLEARQWNRHKINANQITRQRNLETNRINLGLVDPYEFDIGRPNPYSTETYDFDVSRKHTNSHHDIIRGQKNLDPIFLYHKQTNKKIDPNINIKQKMAQYYLDNRHNLLQVDNVDEIVFSILPEILSRYSDCKNKARSLIINELKELVIALENNECHRSP